MPKRLAVGAIPLLIIAPLLMTARYFNSEYLVFHLFPISFLGRTFFLEGTMPAVLNQQELLFYSSPIFYGVSMYPIISFISGFLNKFTGLSIDAGIRLFLALLIFCQCFFVFNLFEKRGKNFLQSWAFTAISCWSIYFMTCVYNRGAFAESLAQIFSVFALGFFLRMVDSEQRHARILNALLFGGMVGTVVVTHPISGLYGCVFFGILFLFSINNLRFVQNGLLAVSSFLVVASPFLYSHIKIGKLLSAATEFYVHGFPDGVDSVFSRLMLVPFDKRSILLGTQVDTPFLDAQISVSALILAGALLALLRIQGKKLRGVPFMDYFSFFFVRWHYPFVQIYFNLSQISLVSFSFHID